jgi:hypothetical protein
MKIEVELDEKQMIPYLTRVAKDQIWHINSTIQSLRENYTSEDRPDYLLKDLQDFFANLDATNKMLVYFGGEPVEVFSAHVTPGYDLDGNPFNK